MHLLSLQFYYIRWTVTNQKFSQRPVRPTNRYIWIQLQVYLRRCGLSLSNLLHEIVRKGGFLILMLRLAHFTVQTLVRISMQNSTLTSHHFMCQTEQKARWFVSSRATAHQVDNNEWIWTWNTLTVAYFVMQFMIKISSKVHPDSIWHIFTFPYPRIVCVTLSFITRLVGRDKRQEQCQEAAPRNNARKMKGTSGKRGRREN